MGDSRGHRRLGTEFWKLWGAVAAANLGDGLALAAFPLLAAALTDDPLAVSGLTTALMLPWFLFALPSGVLVDRMDRRQLMWTVGAARSVVVLLLAVSVATGTLSLPVLYVAAFFLGVGETVYDSASQTILPAIVDRGQLEHANGRLSAALVVTQHFVGSPLGGMLFSVAAVAPLAIHGSAYAAAFLFVFALRGSFRADTSHGGGTRAPMRQEIGEGLRWLWSHRLLRTLGVMVGLLGLMYTVYASILVLYALEVLGLAEFGFGVLLAVAAVGSFLGSVTAERVGRRLGTAPTLLLCVAVAGLTVLATGLTSSPVVAGVMLAANGWAVLVWNVLTMALRQELIPDRLLGRVGSVYRLLSWGTMPIGALIGGAVAQAMTLRAPFFLTAGVYLGMALVATRFITREVIEAARSDAADPATA